MTNDVTPVRNDDNDLEAHKECAKQVNVAYHVTPVGKLEKKIKANKDCTENVNVINDVTSVSDDGMGNKAHRE